MKKIELHNLPSQFKTCEDRYSTDIYLCQCQRWNNSQFINLKEN